MLNKKVAQLLEEQINKELYSAYLYLDISNYYIANNLDGFGNWYKIQYTADQVGYVFHTYGKVGSGTPPGYFLVGWEE